MWKYHIPAYKPPPLFCPMLACMHACHARNGVYLRDSMAVHMYNYTYDTVYMYFDYQWFATAIYRRGRSLAVVCVHCMAGIVHTM